MYVVPLRNVFICEAFISVKQRTMSLQKENVLSSEISNDPEFRTSFAKHEKFVFNIFQILVHVNFGV